MAKDVSDLIGTAIGNAAREAAQGLSSGRKRGGKGMSGGKALAAATAAGAGLAALAPVAGRGVGRLTSGLEHPIDSVKHPIDTVKDAGSNKLKGAGDKLKEDLSGKVKDEVKQSVPGAGLLSKLGGGDDDDDGDSGDGKNKGGVPGVGKGRRMPVQQDIDIGVPLTIVYNEFTQFENWPEFMHRVTSASQDDETHVAFKAKIWGKSKEFKAEITEQRPDERIEWKVVEGMSHTGVVTFHELAPRLTRVELNVDIQPGSLAEKFARGARLTKRAIRADLARFKAHVLMEEEASGEWRGTIEDAEVKPQRSQSGDSSSDDSSSGRSSSGRSSSARKSSSSGRSASARKSASSGRSASSSGRSGSSSRRRSGSSSNGGSAGSRSGSSRSRSSSSANGSSSGSSSRRRSGSRS
jgi:uncharacterized membrane protein